MPRPPDVSFGEHLKNWRQHRNLSQAQLAKLLDVSSPTIHNWETGHVVPRDIEAIDQRMRELQTAKGEPPAPTKDFVRLLWSS